MMVRCVAGDALTAQDVYDIWKIRDAVFAFEQHVEDTDPDDRDLLPDTFHLWIADDAGPTSYLRVFHDEDGITHVGRVCTRADARGHGLSSALMKAAHERWGAGEIQLGAQAYLEDWYTGLGYVRTGDNFDDAGIDHVPMSRAPSGS